MSPDVGAPRTDADASAHRWPAGLLFAGASVLFYRTVALLAGARRVLRPWVLALTVLEMVIDLVTMAGARRWWRSRAAADATTPLRGGAAATVVHAARVGVFIAGRTGPWVDFDVRPEQRAGHRTRWTWGQVGFAGVASVLGLVGLVVIWSRRRRASVGVDAHSSTGGR